MRSRKGVLDTALAHSQARRAPEKVELDYTRGTVNRNPLDEEPG